MTTTASAPSRVTTVYLMRHGQTAYNVEDRFRGRADLALNDTGRAQAHALGELMAGLPITRVLASPLQRAIHTAEPVAAAAQVAVEPIAGLNDRDYGEWTGVERSEVVSRFGSINAAPGVESVQTLEDRVLAAFNALLQDSAGPAIAIVGHDATNRALLMRLIPELKEAPQANGCWNQIDWDGTRWQLRVLNAVPGDGRRPHAPSTTGAHK